MSLPGNLTGERSTADSEAMLGSGVRRPIIAAADGEGLVGVGTL